MFRKKKPAPKPAPCPDCGRPTNLGGRFCRACGWDADLAEGEDAHLDGVKVPEAMDGEGYEDLLADEGLAPRRRRGLGLLWAVVAAALAVLLTWQALRGF